MEQKKYLKQWVIIMSSVLPKLKSNTIPKAQKIPNKINSTLPKHIHTHTHKPKTKQKDYIYTYQFLASENQR